VRPKPELSVVLPAYNPSDGELAATLAALQGQSLPLGTWELVLVDNRSNPPVDPAVVAWHPHGRCIREEAPGLVHARAAGFRHTSAPVVVVVDQDNVLAADYLAAALALATQEPRLGAWGAGNIIPRYERPELAPPASLHSLLTLRHATGDSLSADVDHHDSTPWGAGLCVRREVAAAYVAALAADPLKGQLDLRGDLRLSGGDTDIAYTGCRLGFTKGVFARLTLQHLIPAGRCSAESLCRTAEGRGYSEVLHHLVLHGRLPPPETGLRWVLRRWRRRRGMSALERQVDRARQSGRRRAYDEHRHRGT
jgi:hypothetical protein